MDEYRPDYHIKNKKNGLIISFGPKIKEREPYADIDWDLLVKEYSIAFENKRVKYKKIYIPSAGALAFTKLISFVNRETHKDIQDLQDFVDLTNHKSCALDDLFNLIDRVADKSKLRENFWKKIASKKECASIIAKGNIVVLGSLRGNAYAGAAGDEHTFVAALDMDPVQIKIGNVIGRSSDRGPLSAIKNRRKTLEPQVAVVMDDSILIEPITSGLLMNI